MTLPLKPIDFPNLRRAQGRALGATLRDIAELLQPLAEQQGVDLRARLSEGLSQRSEKRQLLAERLQESVVPLFRWNDNKRPDRIGTCVLVNLNSEPFAFTAGHVLREAGKARLFAPSKGTGGTLLPLPPYTAHLRSGDKNDLDIAVLAMRSEELGCFQQHTFLTEDEIDQEDCQDDEGLASFYFVLGYSASRTQVKVDSAKRHIHQRSFHCALGPVCAAEYRQVHLSQADHIALDFDHGEILTKGGAPPRLQGVSGGGIFHIARETNQGPLVAIATQNRRASRLIVGTRIKHFLAVARQLKP